VIRIAPPPPRIELPRTTWGTRVEHERRNRIRVAVFAYAYEVRDEALIPDAEYDALARSIDPSISTGNPVIDNFFRDHYNPDTGMWIHRHPELWGIEDIYYKHFVT